MVSGVPASPLEGAPLRFDFGRTDSRDKYIKHHCKGQLLQRHPEAVWPCKSVCTVTRDLCRKLSNKSDISFTQILFIMPVIKLSRRTVYDRFLWSASSLGRIKTRRACRHSRIGTAVWTAFAAAYCTMWRHREMQLHFKNTLFFVILTGHGTLLFVKNYDLLPVTKY